MAGLTLMREQSNGVDSHCGWLVDAEVVRVQG